MSTAYVLLSCDLDGVHDIFNKLKNINEIMKSEVVYGPYDIVIKINANDLDEIKKVVNLHIKRIQGVKYVMILPIHDKDKKITS